MKEDKESLINRLLGWTIFWTLYFILIDRYVPHLYAFILGFQVALILGFSSEDYKEFWNKGLNKIKGFF